MAMVSFPVSMGVLFLMLAIISLAVSGESVP